MGAIDDYLGDLARRLRVRLVDADSARRLLAEVEEHLLDATAEEVRRGSEPAQAERRAVERMGSGRRVAGAAAAGHRTLVVSLVRSLAWLGALGSAALGAGALLSVLLARVVSTAWMFGPIGTWRPSPAVVSHVQQLHPGVGWRTAATLENADDTVVLRLLAATLGLAVAVVVLGLTRRRPWWGTGVTDVVGAAVFSVATVALAVSAGTGSPAGDWGRGQSVADAAVALVFSVALGVRAGRWFADRAQPTNRQNGWPAGSAST